MLKIISSKNDSLIYSEIKKIKKQSGFEVATQNISLEESFLQAENISIFDGKEVFVINIKAEEVEKLTQKDVDILVKSEHLFIVIGSGVDFEKTFTKYGLGVIKLAEKAIFDFPAELVTALQKNDRKNSWNLMLKELSKKDAEPTHGVCIFAYKSLLVYLNDEKKNSPNSGVKEFSWQQAKRNSVNVVGGKSVKRERGEVVDKYFNLVLNYHKARMGNGDLAKQLEMWVLR